LEHVFQYIERLVSSLPCGIPVFVTGDFNINILKKASITNKCIQLMNYYGFQQIIKLPKDKTNFNLMFLKMLFIINKIYVKVPDLITLVNIVYCRKFHLGMAIESSMCDMEYIYNPSTC
jgi:hypothetical protein